MNELKDFLLQIPEVKGDIVPSATLADLGVDSVGMIEIIMWLERVKGISPGTYKVTDLVHVSDLEALLAAR